MHLLHLWGELAEVRPDVRVSPGAYIVDLVKVVNFLPLEFVLLTAYHPYLL
jgi:hypothetical protein